MECNKFIGVRATFTEQLLTWTFNVLIIAMV